MGIVEAGLDNITIDHHQERRYFKVKTAEDKQTMKDFIKSKVGHTYQLAVRKRAATIMSNCPWKEWRKLADKDQCDYIRQTLDRMVTWQWCNKWNQILIKKSKFDQNFDFSSGADHCHYGFPTCL